MDNKEEIKKELEELSPLLSRMKDQKNPFLVPPRYFRELPDEVMQRIKEENTTSSSWVQWLSHSVQWLLQPTRAVAIVMVTILLVAGVWFFVPREGNRPAGSHEFFAEITSDDLDAYIQSNIEKFDTDLVLEATDHSGTLPQLPAPSMDQDAIDEYMDELLEELDEGTLDEFL